MNFLKQLLISALFLVIMPFCFAQFSGRPYKEQATAEVVLHHYIYKFDSRIDILPKNLNPEHVVEVVRRELREEKIDSDTIKQIVELADFYNLQSNVRDFLNWLQQKTPSEEQFLNSIVITRAVGILGQGEQLNKGVEYFNYLLGSRYSRNYLTEILNCYGEYNLVISGDVVGVRVKEIMEKLAKEATNDLDAASLFNDVEFLYNNVLPRIVRAADIKRLIIKEQNVQRRLDQLVGIYLNLDADYLEWLERWAIRQLLLEFEASDSKELLSEAFRRGLSRVQASESLGGDAKVISIAVFRAIEFFGGNLSKAELQHAKSVPGNLAGYLSLNK